MSTCAQKLTFHLKKADLEEMLQSTPDYSALEFKICITQQGNTVYLATLVKVETGEDSCLAAIQEIGNTETQICPVPPDCNDNKNLFFETLRNYYNENKIIFQLDLRKNLL